MPRKPAVSPTTIFNVLKNFKIFDEKGNLRKRLFVDEHGYAIWDEASKLLSPMSAQHIYITVHGNRKDLKTDLKRYHCSTLVSQPAQEKKNEFDTTKGGDSSNQSIKENHDDIVVQEKQELPDEYENLLHMKNNVLYNDAIKDICLRPFSVKLRCKEHKDTFKQLVGANCCIGLTILEVNAPLITLKHYNSKKNYIISLVSKVEKDPVYLSQIISENVKSFRIKYFLLDFLKDEIMELPLQFHVAYNTCLLNNVCLAFNMCTFNNYTKQCLKFIQKECESLPTVLLNIDIISILMSAVNSTYFTNLLEVAQEFYLKCIIYLRSVNTLNEFENTVTCMFICLLSPHDNDYVSEKIEILDRKLKNEKVQNFYKKFIEYKEKYCIDSIDDIFNEEKPEVIQVLNYIEDLKSEIVVLSTGDDPNVYGCSEWLNGQLLLLLSLFPSWTGFLFHDRNLDFVCEITAQQKMLRSDQMTFTSFLNDTIMRSKDSTRKAKATLKNQIKRTTKNSIKAKKKNGSNKKQMYQRCEENWKGKNDCYKAAKKLVDEIASNNIVQMKCEADCAPNTVTTKEEATVLSDVQIEFDSNKTAGTLCQSKDVLVIDASGTPVQTTNPKEPIFSWENNQIGFSEKMSPSGEIIQFDEIYSNVIYPAEQAISFSDEHTNYCKKNNDAFTPVANSSFVNCETSINDSGSKISLDHSYARLRETDVLDDFQLNSDNTTNISGKISGALMEKTIPIPKFNTNSNGDNHKYTNENSKKNGKQFCNNNQIYVSVQRINSKYIVAAPGFELAHEQASKNNKNRDSVIRNSTKLEGKTINSTRFTIEDTSKIDVFVEIVSFSCKNFKTFQSLCLNNKLCVESCPNDCFMQTIKQYCVTGLTTKIYDARANWLYKYATVDYYGGVLRIDDTLCNIFRVIIGSHNSFSMCISCLLCQEHEKYLHETVISLRIHESESLSDLQVYLDLYLEIKWRSHENLCKKCLRTNIKNIDAYYYWESYLCIDIEESNVFEFVNSAPPIIQVPSNPNEKKTQYALVGVITPDSPTNSMYVAYCQTIDNFWEKRSGAKKKVQKLDKLPKIKIACLMYINISNK